MSPRAKSEAVKQAREFGFPVVLKLYSETITHKTDVGGVQLNLADEEAVRQAYQAIEASVTAAAGAEHFAGVTVQPMISLEGYELIIGASVDPQFGPVILFGLGGQLVEVFKDRALALPPLNSTLARRLMEQTKIYIALQGVRGRKSVDLAALEELLVRFSQLIDRAAVDQGAGHQSAVDFQRADDRTGCPRRACTRRRRRKASCRVLHSSLSGAVCQPVGTAGRHAGGHSSDSARGRAAAGEVPRIPVRADGLSAVLPGI